MADTTQAAKLEDNSISVTLAGLNEKLKNRKDYEIWTYVAIAQLELHDLDDLVKKSIPRPDPTHPRYRIWTRASKLVRNWLIGQVGKDILNMLRVTTSPTTYADDMWDTIKNIILGHGHSEARSNFKQPYI
ncbi:hypothetical protein CNMCM5793_006329 [Aspergillus hiratsukae]|uniref:Uncharacterized protein n=1 Tax=Aspergillus hiratsukae TaxID=1194566 RepID=A0A8H6PGY0_9EURO|nr:hypothetical protein CNMCM5793_006329 [Aspergillus hiratsukae]